MRARPLSESERDFLVSGKKSKSVNKQKIVLSTISLLTLINLIVYFQQWQESERLTLTLISDKRSLSTKEIVAAHFITILGALITGLLLKLMSDVPMSFSHANGLIENMRKRSEEAQSNSGRISLGTRLKGVAKIGVDTFFSTAATFLTYKLLQAAIREIISNPYLRTTLSILGTVANLPVILAHGIFIDAHEHAHHTELEDSHSHHTHSSTNHQCKGKLAFGVALLGHAPLYLYSLFRGVLGDHSNNLAQTITDLPKTLKKSPINTSFWLFMVLLLALKDAYVERHHAGDSSIKPGVIAYLAAITHTAAIPPLALALIDAYELSLPCMLVVIGAAAVIMAFDTYFSAPTYTYITKACGCFWRSGSSAPSTDVELQRSENGVYQPNP